MSLSPFDSFQSRFVTYLLNFPRSTNFIAKTVHNLPDLLSMALRISSIRHRHTECLYDGYILTAGSDGSDSSSAGVATNYTHGHD